MEKMQRYVGLLAAVVLAVLALLPLGPDRHFPLAMTLTPLDRTVLTALTIRKTESMRIWMYATDYMRGCPPFVEGRATLPRSCIGGDHLFITFPQENATDLAKLAPDFAELATAYKASKIAENVAWRQKPDMPREPKNLVAELKIGAAIASYLDNQKSNIAATIYAVHLMLACVVWLMIAGRQAVGGVILSPLKLFGVGARAAKALHEKV